MNEHWNPPGIVGSLVPASGPRTVQLNLRQALALARKELTAGKWAIAEQIYRQILQAAPNTFEAWHNLAMALLRLGRAEDALSAAEAAVKAQPGNFRGLHIRACVLTAMCRDDEAIADYRKTLDMAPDFVEAWKNLGNTCLAKGDLDQAAAVFERMLTLMPGYTGPLLNVSVRLNKQGQYVQAEAVLRKVLQTSPDSYAALSNLGLVLTSQERFDEAMEYLRRAVNIRPETPNAHLNIANVLMRQGRRQEGMDTYDAILKIHPDLPSALFNRSLTLLRWGRLEQGWKDYAQRWRWPEFDSCFLHDRFTFPSWTGQELHGQRICIHYEQGIGDVIQFARYLPMVARRGGRVIVEVHDPLVRLMKRVQGVEESVRYSKKPPEVPAFAAIMDLPGIFGTTLENIPADVPYIEPYPEDVAVWKQRLEGESRLRVGVVWAGNAHNPVNAHRSMNIEALRPLLQLEGAAFYSLQVGGSEDIQRLGQDASRLRDLSEHLKDFADTAAAISQLDLVIAVDTAVVHLAGAMNKPVWLLLYYQGDWRWLEDRSDSPWYPSLRIFRQAHKDDWTEIVAQAADALAERIRQHSLRPASP